MEAAVNATLHSESSVEVDQLEIMFIESLPMTAQRWELAELALEELGALVSPPIFYAHDDDGKHCRAYVLVGRISCLFMGLAD